MPTLYLRLSLPAEGSSKPVSNTRRVAVNTAGYPGSLYDIHRDHVLNKLNIKTRRRSLSTSDQNQCRIVKGNVNQNEDLCQLLNIQNELYLSLSCNLVPKAGITAAIHHSHPIDECTRFLRFTNVSAQEEINAKNKEIRKEIDSIMDHTDITHMITEVQWGIDCVVVLQLPPAKCGKIDRVLEKINAYFHGDTTDEFRLTPNEEKCLNQIVSTNIYSNITEITKFSCLRDIYQNMHTLKANHFRHQRISYTLQSVRTVYLLAKGKRHIFPSVSDESLSESQTFGQYLNQLSTRVRSCEMRINEILTGALGKHLKTSVNEVYPEWLHVNLSYNKEIERLAQLVVAARKKPTSNLEIDKSWDDEEHQKLVNSINALNQKLEKFESKRHLIDELEQQEFQYWDVHGLNISKSDYQEQKLEQILLRDHQNDRILCSSDTLKNEHTSTWIELQRQLIEERRSHPNIRLIYADFSYCHQSLQSSIILPIEKPEKSRPLCDPISSSAPGSGSDAEVINILLLGESGVGKSTFINALVNYITYTTLQDAQSNPPIVLIPVSFLMTYGKDLEEKLIQFGEREINEDFDHPGQSVTQKCRSYLFDLKRSDGKKVRIIDTPGFVDVRGHDQDDKNMQHILEYIMTLTHLHAVCFLLKPNITRLHSSVRSCFYHLLELLSPNIRRNIIFCFTNTRSTFYSVGDTGPALRALLQSLPTKDIPFTKQNIFCFDSEAFRYLIAVQNSVEITEVDRKEYENSWTTSAKESNRLIDSLCYKVPVYHIQTQWKSKKHAQMEIRQLIRPLLETMRNTLRNVILLRKDTNSLLIQLNPKSIQHSTVVCHSGKSTSINNFYIMTYQVHDGLECTSSADQPSSVEYTLDYRSSTCSTNLQEHDMNDRVTLLLHGSVELAYFLHSNGRSDANDLFSTGFERMIMEEKTICREHQSNPWNQELLDGLTNLKRTYESRLMERKTKKDISELPVIYERIQTTYQYPDVKEQMIAVKESQQNIMKLNERVIQVTSNQTNTSECVTNQF